MFIKQGNINYIKNRTYYFYNNMIDIKNVDITIKKLMIVKIFTV